MSAYVSDFPEHFAAAEQQLRAAGGGEKSLAQAARAALRRARYKDVESRFEHAGRSWWAVPRMFGVGVRINADDAALFLYSYD